MNLNPCIFQRRLCLVFRDLRPVLRLRPPVFLLVGGAIFAYLVAVPQGLVVSRTETRGVARGTTLGRVFSF